MLGTAAASTRVHPCLEWTDDLPALLDHLGRDGVVQAMVEGGARVVRSFFDLDLIDRYVLYMAPLVFAGTDAIPMIAGPSAASMDTVWRGRFDGVTPLGDDMRIDLIPTNRSTP